MDEKTAWEKFIKNGRIADYLEYKNAINEGEEKVHESFDKRPDYKG